MTHKINLAYKIVSTFKNVSKVEEMIRDLHSYYSNSPKRFLEFQKFAIGLTEGKNILKDVDTIWISMYEPSCIIFDKYPSLIGFMYKYRRDVDKAKDQLCHLTDI